MSELIKKTNKPRILILTPRYPYPVIGGDRLRIFEICRDLSKYAELTLLSLCDNKADLDVALPEDGVFVKAHKIYLPKWKSYINVLKALTASTPLQVAYYHSKPFSNILESLLPKHDLVLGHLARTGDYIKSCQIPSVVEMTDAISMNYERSSSISKAKSLLSIVYATEASRIKKYELNAVNEHHLLSFVSTSDTKFLYGNKLPSNVLVCGNGVDTNKLKRVNCCQRRPIVAFIGNMLSMQNRDAAFWFATHVLPKLRGNGDFRFRVVGQISERSKAAFEKIEGVEVTGKVDNVANSVSDCFSGVCSVRIGAGVQNKLLEYMSLGLPAVTTSIGLEGIDAKDGVDLWVADSPDDFVEKILFIWENEAIANEFATRARRYVEINHTWSNILKNLTESIIYLANKSNHDKLL